MRVRIRVRSRGEVVGQRKQRAQIDEDDGVELITRSCQPPQTSVSDTYERPTSVLPTTSSRTMLSSVEYPSTGTTRYAISSSVKSDTSDLVAQRASTSSAESIKTVEEPARSPLEKDVEAAARRDEARMLE